MNRSALRKNPQAGFTLIELMIVVSIIPILAMAFVIILSLYPKKYAEIEHDRQMTEHARNALQYIGRDIRSAKIITSTAGSYSTTGNDTLVLVPSDNITKRVVWTSEDDELVRLEFADARALNVIDRTVFSTPSGKLILRFDDNPPLTSMVVVTVEQTREVLNQSRTISLSGRFFLRGKMQ